MAKRIKFEPKQMPNGKWQLNVPGKLTETGNRERHYFKTKQLAKNAGAKMKEKLAEFGTQSKAIRPSLAEAATLAETILAPWNISLVDAAREVAAARERETASCPLAAAADDWLVACEGLRTKTQQGYRQTANRLKAALGERILATLTASDLQTALAPAGTPATAAAGHLRNGKAMWHFAARRGRCSAEVFAGVESPKTGRDSDEIAILTAPEAEALLRATETHFPQAVASYALQLFGGIRAEEITRLESCHVSADGIELPASVTKKGRRRHITPSKTLAAWLARFPFEPCPDWRRVDRACRRLAGWEVVADILDDPPAATRGRWPQNALRHSHASYSVAAGVPLEALLFEFGHAGTPTLLRQHYVGRASKKQALAFFAIRPEGSQAAGAQLETVEAVA